MSEREREIAVVVITSHWHSAYPTAAHEKRGKEVGLPADAVEAIIAGLPASFADAREETACVSLTMNFHAVPAGSPGLAR